MRLNDKDSSDDYRPPAYSVNIIHPSQPYRLFFYILYIINEYHETIVLTLSIWRVPIMHDIIRCGPTRVRGGESRGGNRSRRLRPPPPPLISTVKYVPVRHYNIVRPFKRLSGPLPRHRIFVSSVPVVGGRPCAVAVRRDKSTVRVARVMTTNIAVTCRPLPIRGINPLKFTDPPTPPPVTPASRHLCR